MTGSISAYTNLQKNPQKKIIGNSAVIGAASIVLYTVPTGKKTIINAMLDRVVGYGTGTLVTFSIAGQAIRTKTGAGVPELVFTNENVNQLSLEAGDTIEVLSDAAGNNASAAWLISITELPA